MSTALHQTAVISDQAIASPAPPEIADLRISDRYELRQPLGQGGTAVVYDAWDRELGRAVAVKVLRHNLQQTPQMIERFVNEARIMGRLNHPGAVAIYETGKFAEGKYFYAMKKVAGQTLRQLLESRDSSHICCPHDMAHLLNIFERVCETVAYAHNHGIIHRDIKPENVMVEDFGSVLLMDWGLSKALVLEADGEVNRTALGTIKGTPAYMSPEQATGQTFDVDYRTDVFALGIVLYEMITGVKPFRGDSPREMLASIVYDLPTPPRKVRRFANREVAAICMKALSKDPDARYETAQEMATDIRNYLEFRSVEAYHESLAEMAWKWMKRHPIVSTCLTTLLLAAVVVFAAVSYHGLRERRIITEATATVDSLAAKVERAKLAVAAERDRLDVVPADERQAVVARIAELSWQKHLLAEQQKILLAAVLGRTYGDTPPRLLEMYRSLHIEELQELIDENQLLKAKAQLEQVLQKCEKGNLLCWSDAEIDRLSEMFDQVEAAIAAE